MSYAGIEYDDSYYLHRAEEKIKRLDKENHDLKEMNADLVAQLEKKKTGKKWRKKMGSNE